MNDNFDFIYDWTTESDIKKRKLNAGNNNNGIELKTTTTKDVEIKSKKKANKEDEKVMEGNSINNIKNHDSNNNLNLKLIKEDENEVIKMEENNLVNDKVDSRCCIM